MYRTIADFSADFTEDSAEMAQNFAALTDAALDVRVLDGQFSIRELALHIVNAWPEALAEAGEPLAWEKLPATASAAEIAGGWERLRETLPAHVAASWTDAALGQAVSMWGMEWTKAKVLWEMQKHTVHHHGQLTVLMRLAGLPVHGIYGPSKEETTALNAQGS